MEGIRTWAVGLCAAAMAGGLTELLLPKAGLRRVLQMTVSVFFLTCIFAPVPWSGEGFSLETDVVTMWDLENVRRETAVLEQAWSVQQEDYTERALELRTSRLLEVLEIPWKKISFLKHTDEQGRIWISECEIQLAAEADVPKETLQVQLGMPVRVKQPERAMQ